LKLREFPLLTDENVDPGHIEPQFTMAMMGALLNTDPDVTPPFVLVARRSGNQVTIRVRALGS
jgi:hypothetical protein